MHFFRSTLVIALACAGLLLPTAASQRQRHVVRAHPRRGATRVSAHAARHPHPSTSRSHHTRRQTASKTHTAASKSSGISPARASEIQNALVRAGYLQRNSGVWDADTEAALRRYQHDHHWQSHIVPDARALIALGLGPRQDQGALYPAIAKTPPPTLAAAPVPPADSRTP